MDHFSPCFSHKSDHWSTPEDLFIDLDQEFHFTLDPCPLHSDFDGLSLSWDGFRVFCNPPYSFIRTWVFKSYNEWVLHDSLVVLLLPARTDTVWFHEFILPYCEIRFIRGRLRFGGSKNNAPFPSMVCIFHKKGGDFFV